MKEGSTGSTTLTDDYTVNWHLPLEDFRPDPSHNPATVEGVRWNTSASTWTRASTVEELTYRTGPKQIEVVLLEQSMVLGITGAGAYYSAGLATGPATLVAVAAAGLGYLVQEGIEEEHRERTVPVTYGMWTGAVDDQNVIQDAVDNGTTLNSTPVLLGFTAQEVRKARDEVDAADPTKDAFWHAGDLQIKVLTYATHEKRFKMASRYDANGYKGEEPVVGREQKQSYLKYFFRRAGSGLEPNTPNTI